jgi:hypothetical protein
MAGPPPALPFLVWDADGNVSVGKEAASFLSKIRKICASFGDVHPTNPFSTHFCGPRAHPCPHLVLSRVRPPSHSTPQASLA